MLTMVQNPNIISGIKSLDIKSNSRIDGNNNFHKCVFPECDKIFGKKSRLVQHVRTHTGERPFSCWHEECDKSYTRNFHLNRHISKAHNKNENISEHLSCDLCENIYNNKYSLQKHRKTHEASPYTCTVCGKSFRKEQLFKSHSYEHTGIKPYKCNHPECGKSFLFSSKLKKHAEVHTSNRYKCYHQNCSTTFNVFNQYRIHLCKDHPKVCIECNEEYPTNRKLNAHLQTHHEREIFHCSFNLCDRYYFHEKNLKAHIRTSHDSNFQGFKCTNCDILLSSKQKLNLHMKTHSPKYQRRRYTSDKPRRTRKDKSIRKRSIYSVLSGYDDRKMPADAVDTSKQTIKDNSLITSTSTDVFESIIAGVNSQIMDALQLHAVASI